MIAIRSWRDVTIIDHSNAPSSTALIDTALDSAIDQFPNNFCAYWLHVPNMVDTVGEKKYKNLHVSYIAKAALRLSHSNASPERGFSLNSALMTKERDHCQNEAL